MDLIHSDIPGTRVSARAPRSRSPWRFAVLIPVCLAAAAGINLLAARWLDNGPRRAPSPLFSAPIAVRDLQEMVDRYPRERDWIDRLAIAYVQQGHYLSAIEMLERSLAMEGPQVDARRAMVLCLNRLERYQEALPHLRTLIEIQPDSFDLRLDLAEQHRLIGDRSAGKAVLDKIPRDMYGYPHEKEVTNQAASMERLAAAYGLLGYWDDCARLARQLIKDTPSRWGAHVVLGKSLLSRNQTEAAVRHIRLGMRADATDPDLKYLLATALQQRGRASDLPEIKRLLLETISKKRMHGRAWYEMGLICRRERNWNRAAQSFRNAYSLGVDQRACLKYQSEALGHLGNREESLYTLGLYYEDLGQPDKALVEYKKLTTMHESCGHGLMHMARARGLMGQPKEQLRLLVAARKILGPQPRLLQDFGNCYAELKKRDLQKKTWEAFIRADSKNADLGYQQLGALADSMGNLEEAERHYRKCVEMQPASETYKQTLAHLLLERREDPARVAEAARLLEDAARLARDNSSILIDLGIAYQHAGRLEDAVLVLRHAVDLEPGDGRAYFPLSQVLLATGRKAEGERTRQSHAQYLDFLEAQEVLSARVRRTPGDPEVRRRLAQFYERAQAVENAIGEYEKLVEMEPENRNHYRSLAQLYEEMGRFEDARRAKNAASAGDGARSAARTG